MPKGRGATLSGRDQAALLRPVAAVSRNPSERSHADTSSPSCWARSASACFCSSVTRTRMDCSFRCAFGFLCFMMANVDPLGNVCNPR